MILVKRLNAVRFEMKFVQITTHNDPVDFCKNLHVLLILILNRYFPDYFAKGIFEVVQMRPKLYYVIHQVRHFGQ